MTDSTDTGLLPVGFADILPADAEFEADAVERLMRHFKARGYARIKPPLLEFESSLHSGPGAAMEGQTLRLVDPATQNVMGIRADHTPQAARIAATRLAKWPRPLRLCYAGEVVRVRGGQIRPERQFAQVGAELIGASSAAADIEVIAMAAEALADLGAEGLSVDLGLPNLAPTLAGDTPDWPALSRVLDSKDTAALSEFSPAIGADRVALFRELISLSGRADAALTAMAGLSLPAGVQDQVADLEAVVRGLQAKLPGLALTIDPVEHRGFEYHAGISFTIFAKGVRGELGSGGRYSAHDTGGTGVETGEQATGFSLFTDSLLRALPRPAIASRALAAKDAAPDEVARLRREGWMVIDALNSTEAPDEIAPRLGCGHVLDANGLRALGDAPNTND